jgi:DNA/RNA-binding domain of Phe-tRNA-synthetase-like protein
MMRGCNRQQSAATVFSHAPAIWQAFPELAAGVAHLSGVHTRVSVDAALARHVERASSHLHSGSESDLPPIQAWRRAFARMGLKPTQYRCASEALLRRLRKEGSLPRLHPLVDLCNAVSAAYAIPIAVFDLAHVSGALEVRRADGDEDCLAFGGEHERPEVGEVVFADTQRRVHARRWCNRQSAWSAIRPETGEVLIVAEGMHDTAARDVPELIDTLVADLAALWGSRARHRMLTSVAPRFDWVGDPARHRPSAA